LEEEMERAEGDAGEAARDAAAKESAMKIA